ncbi:hypothetical protein EGT09_22155 [Pseudomonas putida]|nr:hypothetical protein EGT09_22155 [Pseudomonas putida]
MGAGLSGRRTAANTGKAGAIHRGVLFAGKPAPTESRSHKCHLHKGHSRRSAPDNFQSRSLHHAPSRPVHPGLPSVR